MKIFVDVDGTVFKTPEGGKYKESEPIKDRIAAVNKLYDAGHEITYYTARGTETGLNWKSLTIMQLRKWGCRYHKLLMGKPTYDLMICDKSVNSENFFYIMGLLKNENS